MPIPRTIEQAIRDSRSHFYYGQSFKTHKRSIFFSESSRALKVAKLEFDVEAWFIHDNGQSIFPLIFEKVYGSSMEQVAIKLKGQYEASYRASHEDVLEAWRNSDQCEDCYRRFLELNRELISIPIVNEVEIGRYADYLNSRFLKGESPFYWKNPLTILLDQIFSEE